MTSHTEQESHTTLTYRLMAPLSWTLVVVVGIYHTVHSPNDVKHGHRIFQQANKPTPFTQSGIITGAYWITLLLSQLNYLYHLFYGSPAIANPARTVSTHFTLNNLFLFSWIILWTRNHFSASTVFLIASYLNQHAVYAQHPRLPVFVHLPVVAGPYAWALLGLFWNVAVAVGANANSLPVRVLGNLLIWVVLGVGSALVASSADYVLASCLAWLALSLAIKQFFIKVVALQWIFAFVVFAVFLVEALYLGGARLYGRDSLLRRIREPEADVEGQAGVDREREPLLAGSGSGSGSGPGPTGNGQSAAEL